MSATRTIRRSAVAIASLALLGACHSEVKRAPEKPRARAAAGLASARLGEAAGEARRPAPTPTAPPSAVVQTLRALRDQRLEIAPPGAQSALLAFGTGRLAQASGDKVTFRDSTHGQVITEASVGSVRAVSHGVDGSLFAIGDSDGARLEPRANVAKRFPHVVFLPGSVLFPDLEDPSHFFVYYGIDQQLSSYPFQAEAGSILAFETSFQLTGCGSPLAELRDGAIICRTSTGFLRQAPRGSRAEFAFPFADDPPIRLLPAQRLDEFFAVSKAGEVIHLRLAGGLTVLARFQLPAPAYAASANTEALAFVLVSGPQPGQARRWSLYVTDSEGRPRLQRELPSAPTSADEDWLATLVEDKNLAISGFEPLVAVGGARRVSVWDYARARELFSL